MNRLRSPEMSGLQQAIMRTERINVSALDVVGRLRRPNLLGAVVLKSEAPVTDNRDRNRHRSDLVALGSVAALHPDLAVYANESTPKDQRRIGRALDGIPVAMWSVIADPEAARDALSLLRGE